ncbi:MAG: RNase adapter RapZ [Salinivirgaceae bacterium]|nr:RNase adapter RapZ [Salinivirgaceae bacterium]
MNIDIIKKLCLEHLNEQPEQIEKIPQSGSNRIYVRLHLKRGTVIGVFNPNLDENRAFTNLSNAFIQNHLSVPQILGIDKSNQYYLCTDHGNTTLFDLINKRTEQQLNPELRDLYKQSLVDLMEFQLTPKSEDFYRLCDTPQHFDQRTILWDLHYFKYNFLKYKHIQFNEYNLENDFEQLSKKIAILPLQGFMYRDFQSRNIMMEGNKATYIDFQGGRKGPLQYDVVSFLWQARANLCQSDKDELLHFYTSKLEEKRPKTTDTFMRDFNSVLLLRLLQVLGAYGYRGLYERKNHFIKSIPNAIVQLEECWNTNDFNTEYPELNRCVQQLVADKKRVVEQSGLMINITSFSFINGGYPTDETEHGGGYIFDCRGLPNPGREVEYKLLTGKNQKVIDYMLQRNEVQEFIDNAYTILERHATNYKERGFDVLNIGFGCTGGQHRSIYCAESINKRFQDNGFKTKLWHREFPEIK